MTISPSRFPGPRAAEGAVLRVVVSRWWDFVSVVQVVHDVHVVNGAVVDLWMPCGDCGWALFGNRVAGK